MRAAVDGPVATSTNSDARSYRAVFYPAGHLESQPQVTFNSHSGSFIEVLNQLGENLLRGSPQYCLETFLDVTSWGRCYRLLVG